MGHRLLDSEPPREQSECPEAAHTSPHRDLMQRPRDHVQRQKPRWTHCPPALCPQLSTSTNWLQPQKWPEPESPSQAPPQFMTHRNHEIILSHFILRGHFLGRKNKWNRLWHLEGRCCCNTNLEHVELALGWVTELEALEEALKA